jgi:hypothetical protein
MHVPFNCPRTCPAYKERWCRFRPITDKLGPIKVDSHVARVDITINDLDALDAACARLGLKLARGQTSYKWYGAVGMTEADLGKCTHAIKIPGCWEAYEVGVVENADGTFGLLWDFYHGGYGLQERVGEDCKKLVAEYTFAVAEKAAQAQGWLYERTSEGLRVFHPSGGTMMVSNAGQLDATGFVGGACHEAVAGLGLKVKDVQIKGESCHVAAQVHQGSR